MDTALLNLSTKLSASSPQPPSSLPSNPDEIAEKRKFFQAAMDQLAPQATTSNGIQKKESEKEMEVSELASRLGNDETTTLDKLAVAKELITRVGEGGMEPTQILKIPSQPEGGYWKQHLNNLSTKDSALQKEMVKLVGAITHNEPELQKSTHENGGIAMLVEIYNSIISSEKNGAEVTSTEVTSAEKLRSDLGTEAIKSLIKATRNYRKGFRDAQRRLPDLLKDKIAQHLPSPEPTAVAQSSQPNLDTHEHTREPNTHSNEQVKDVKETGEVEKQQSAEAPKEAADSEMGTPALPPTGAVQITLKTMPGEESPETATDDLPDSSVEDFAQDPEADGMFRYLNAKNGAAVDWLRDELFILAKIKNPFLQNRETEDEAPTEK